MHRQQALVDVEGGREVRPELLEVVADVHDKDLDPFRLVTLDQGLVLGHDDEGFLTA